MRNFFQRFMYGRYGSDQLNAFLLVLFWLFWLINLFVSAEIPSTILSVLSGIAFLFSLFRLFSRNYNRRSAENEAFLKIFDPISRKFKGKFSQMRDKDHVYFKCPNCSSTLRVPKGKGKINITCRSCGTTFQKKT